MLTATNTALRAEVQSLPESESRGVFRAINLMSGKSTKVELARRLCAIHRRGWLPAKRLSGGKLVDCRGSNCGGYTLEAALGVSANSASEPDFLGWEVKQHAVNRLESPRPGRVTLMTPEPTAGVYVDDGVEQFVRRFGYLDKRGRADRMNFGGIYTCDKENISTKLTLRCNGFDSKKGSMTNLDGGVELLDAKGTVAARWAFRNLLDHWKRKHGAAAFVPSITRSNGGIEYQYGSQVSLGEGADFVLFLKSLASGLIYYDPGIKLEGIASGTPTTKRRSQFRAKFTDLASLYQRFEVVDVCKSSFRK